MANEAIPNIALLYSMVALAGEGSGGGSGSGTVSVKVHATYTIESSEEARVENVGTEQDVQLDFYILLRLTSCYLIITPYIIHL